jgi:hypothetical protein
MAQVTLKNEAGIIKEAKAGFSWTVLFFGGFVAMFRGEWSEVAKWIFLNPITFYIWGIAQAFTQNKKTLIRLLERGYKPATPHDKEILQQKNIVA